VLEALEATALATWLRHSTIAYPLVSAGHIMAVGALFTMALLMDIRLLGGLGRLPVNVVAEILQPVAAVAFAAVATTGGLLFAVSAGDYVENPAFRLKMLLLTVALANVASVHLTGLWRRWRAAAGLPPRLAAHALLSLVTWSAVLISGRFVGFV